MRPGCLGGAVGFRAGDSPGAHQRRQKDLDPAVAHGARHLAVARVQRQQQPEGAVRARHARHASNQARLVDKQLAVGFKQRVEPVQHRGAARRTTHTG